MAFWKIFWKTKPMNSMQKVAALTEQGNYFEALEAIDSTLSLGREDGENQRKLRGLCSSMGKDYVSAALALRGKTIADALLMLHRRAQTGGIDTTTKSKIATLEMQIEQQQTLVRDMFWDSVENVAFVGQILFLMNENEIASTFIERALKLRPSDMMARTIKEMMGRAAAK